MNRLAGWLLVVGSVVTALGIGSARAQSNPGTITYPPGWNMVGGPPGTDFSGAEALFAYGPSGYYTPSSTLAALCQGYFAYLSHPLTVALAAPVTSATQSCALQPGWNLVGDPFLAPAALPAGITGFHYDPVSGQYQLVGSIPAGGADWVYSASASVLTLQNPSPTPPTLVISSTNPGPYTVHVGDTVTLLLPIALPYHATATATFLQFEAAGESGDLTCIGDPTCVTTLINEFWTWKAVAAGVAQIAVVPTCTLEPHPCLTPTSLIEIDILP